jgi:hypothetical protein
MPRLTKVVAKEEEEAAEAARRREIERRRVLFLEKKEREEEAKRVRWKAWREVRETELVELEKLFDAGDIEAVPFTRREKVLEKELGATFEQWDEQQEAEDEVSKSVEGGGDASSVDEDEIFVADDVEELDPEGKRLLAPGGVKKEKRKVAAMSAKRIVWVEVFGDDKVSRNRPFLSFLY